VRGLGNPNQLEKIQEIAFLAHATLREFCLGKDLVVENPADLARLGQNTWWCGEAYIGRRLRFTVA